MVRKKRKGVVKQEAQAVEGGNAASPPGVDLRQVLEKVPTNIELPAALSGGGSSSWSDLAQWYDALCLAHRNVYAQRKQLQLFRSKCKLLISGTDSALECAIWRLVFRLSMQLATQPLRKNLDLILAVLAQDQDSASQLRVVAATELRLFLDTLWADAHTLKPLPVEHRVVVLDQLLHVIEFPFLARVLVENPSTGVQYGDAQHLLQFVTCCADQLEALGAPIVEYHEAKQAQDVDETEGGAAAGTSTNVVLVASERCGHALKSVIVLATMKDMLDRRLEHCRGPSLDLLLAAFLCILNHCVLLLQTTVVHKDLLTQTGLAYCLVLRVLLRFSVNAPDVSGSVTKLLLQTAFPGLAIVSTGTCTSSPLRVHIEEDMKSFVGLSRLAVYRGLLNSLSNDDLALPAEQVGLENEAFPVEQTVLNAMFVKIQHWCDQESYNTRLYAFQVLEAFLRRAALILHKKQACSAASHVSVVLSDETLAKLTTAVLLNWEHPSKKVNQFMAVVFAHIVDYSVLSGEYQKWSETILPFLVELPSTSRAKYGSLTLLVEVAGATPVLQASPSLLSSLLSAVGQKDYAAPAAANLFAQILDNLSPGSSKNSKCKPDDEAVVARRELWLSDVVCVLLSSDANLRSRVAMYVIPLLLKKDPDCVPILIKCLQEVAVQDQADTEAVDIALWAELVVLKFARKKIAPEKLTGVSMDHIPRGLCHANMETRGTAFDALCASLKSTSMPSDDELRWVKHYLVVNGKEIGPSVRMNTLIGLKTVLTRIKETLRVTRKDVTEEAADKRDNADMHDKCVAAVSFKHWIERFVVASIYPGALPQRLTLGLEVLLLYIQLFGVRNDEAEELAGSFLLTGHMVTALLNMLTSAWDSVRSLAFTILDLYPDDLPGYSTREELRTFVDWAVGLCGSPRQRESDAGAMFIRLLFQKCSSAIQRYGLSFQCTPEPRCGATGVNSGDPDVAFVSQLTQVILTRVEALSLSEIRQGKSPLVHGFLLSLHYVLDNVSFEKHSGSKAADWSRAMKQVFAAIHQSMGASLAVVGDATSGAGDENLSASFAGVVGEVSTVAETSSSALRVDCRGHLIVEDGGDHGDDDGGNTEQRAVVGSWLAVRECGAIMELLMRRVPLPTSNPTSASVSLFTVDMAQLGGETLLNSLFELKHKGAVATVYHAFEGVCRAFLAHGEQSAVLGNLPAQWADRLLDRLERSEQHFILRRSSGFAFSFVAILRAEPRNSAAVILPKVMLTLLRLAGNDTDAVDKCETHEEHHSQWRARVHALNILKLICQDGVLAEDVACYVVDMFQLSVRGFECGSWAVRNSSMMLFAAAAQRVIGDKRIADGKTRQQVACDDVFSRFQQLRNFLARELTRLLEIDSESSGTKAEAEPTGLYSLLLFLSRLHPNDDDDQRVANARVSPCDDESGLASFVQLVIKCASQSTMAIRHMAAKVLASIVRDADAAPVLSILCTKLPQGVVSARDRLTVSNAIPHNFVHGVLAQIRHLTRKYLVARDVRKKLALVASDTQSEIFEVVVTKLLPSTMWLWTGQDAGSLNAVIRAELVAIVDIIVQFYAQDASSALSTLRSDSTKKAFVLLVEQIQVEVERQLQQRCDSDWATAVRLSNEPGMYVLDRTLVSIWFSIQAMSANGRLQDLMIMKMLVSHVLEIRKNATKQLVNNLVITTLDTESVAELQTILIGQFLVESHPKLRARQLQLLVSCQLHQAIAITQSQRLELQIYLTRLLGVSADIQVIAPTLEMLALMAHQQPCKSDAEIALYQTLCEEIELRSDEAQPLMIRQAAASTLHHSGLLLLQNKQVGSTVCADLALAGWTGALRLLQDDDMHVRAIARHAIENVLRTVDTADSSLSSSDATVLPLAVEYVVSSFARTGPGAMALSTMLIQLIDAPIVLTAYVGAAGAKAVDWDNLYRRIFESESSNYFAERDGLAQHMAYYLLTRPTGDKESIRLLCEQVLALLIKALPILNQEGRCTKEEANRWLGGITYYSDVFAPLFGLLAAGVAVVTSMSYLLTDDLQSLAFQVRELAQEACDIYIDDDVIHPLVMRALKLLACGDRATPQPDGIEPVRELLFLTPHWMALTDSVSN
uniref:Uncharacterized protein n=2 Tax=Hyaloperonospora arabidopsidis (strain Emoy2) TaxID=559515 RepID=M4BBZ5_HYAAE